MRKGGIGENGGNDGVVAVAVRPAGTAEGFACVVGDGTRPRYHAKAKAGARRKRVDGEPRGLKQPRAKLRRQPTSKRRAASNAGAATAAALRNDIVGPQ